MGKSKSPAADNAGQAIPERTFPTVGVKIWQDNDGVHMETMGAPSTIELLGFAEFIAGQTKLVLFDHLRAASKPADGGVS